MPPGAVVERRDPVGRSHVVIAGVRRLLTLIVAVAAIELALRGVGWWYLRKHRWVPDIRQVAENNVVLCLGESSTQGLWCDVADSYPKQLERLLNDHAGAGRYLSVVPWHVGQNTSQVAHRMVSYLDAYHPRLVILMCGVNNMWSLAESGVMQFFHGSLVERWQLQSAVFLSDFRTYKLLRLLGQRLFHIGQTLYPAQYAQETLGYPAQCFPLDPATATAAARHRQAFVEAWRDDMRSIIHVAQRQDVPVLLMTYHINADFLPATEYVSLAAECRLPVVRNDLAFAQRMREPAFRMDDVFHRDHWHPNARGYAVIARNAFDVIRATRLLETHAHYASGRLVEVVQRTGPGD